MPSIAVVVLCYAAGALAGLGAAFRGAVGAAVLLVLASIVRREARLAAASAAVAAGLLAGAAAARSDRACARGIARVGAARIVAPLRVAPGDFVVARLTGADGCGLEAAISVRSGALAAGTRGVVAGRLSLSPRGVAMMDADVRAAGPSRGLSRLRERLGRTIDDAFLGDAPIARALLIADVRAIPVETRDRFARAGLVHMLSISGLHVGIIAAAVLLLVRAARAPPRLALLVSVALTAAYVAVIGAPAPALRAAAMLGVSAASRWLDRPTSPWALLAVGAGFPLADPRIAGDLGFQLSVLGIAALIVAARLERRWVRSVVPGPGRIIVVGLLASTIATIVTTPLVAWRFGQVSLVGPFANLAAAPLMAAVQPALFLALVVSPIPGAARFVAGAAHPLLAAFDRAATIAASAPFATLPVALPAPTLAMVALAIVLAAAAVLRDDPWPPLVGALACIVAAIVAPLDVAGARTFELHMIDVGQGDALALRTPRGRWVLIDAGRSWPRGDAARATILPYLRLRGGDVYALALSHPHTDHVGGAASILAQRRPTLLLDPGFPGPSGSYGEALHVARTRDWRWRRAHPGDSLVIDGVVLRVLAPDSAWTAALDDPNLASLVLSVRYGRVRFLFTGDAEREEEQWLLERDALALRADVLKVAHHGSSTSSTAAFVAAVRPRLALVSVGAGNAYGHPSPDVVGRLASAGATVLRTDRSGTIVVRTDGVALSVQTDGRAWDLPR